jgi:UTP--glucose-1-phosphate uridylyltransferase
MDVKKAVIPAAGLGTRFLPATKSQPKEMLPIIDKPTIHFVIEELIGSGIEDIIIVTGRGKRAIEDYFDKNIELEAHLKEAGKMDMLKQIQELSDIVDIHYVRQKDQLGLGHAVLCAERHIGGEPFALLLGDTIIDGKVPCTRQLISLAAKYGSSAVAVKKVPRESTGRYGIIGGREVSSGVIDITALVEKPAPGKAPSDMAMIGRYVFTPEIFDSLRGTASGVGGEVQLTDGMKGLLKSQKIYGCEVEGAYYDIGDRLDYLKATVEFALKRPDLSREFKAYLNSIK